MCSASTGRQNWKTKYIRVNTTVRKRLNPFNFSYYYSRSEFLATSINCRLHVICYNRIKPLINNYPLILLKTLDFTPFLKFYHRQANMFGKEFWRKRDLKKNSLPDEVNILKDKVTVKEGVKEIDEASVFYQEALPPSGAGVITMLLLHGRMFSSQTWLDLGTIHLLAAMGFHTVAIDIPGYANSPAAEIPDRVVFLQHVIDSFDLKNVVIVSPSMSGFFTLPYLLKYWKNLAGYIPVAPVGIEVLEKVPSSKDPELKNQVYEPLQEFLPNSLPDLSEIQTPTMVVFGEKDRSQSSALLSLLPCSQCQEIPDGSHPAYIDNPDLWHQLLYNFLKALEDTYCLEQQ